MVSIRNSLQILLKHFFWYQIEVQIKGKKAAKKTQKKPERKISKDLLNSSHKDLLNGGSWKYTNSSFGLLNVTQITQISSNLILSVGQWCDSLSLLGPP